MAARIRCGRQRALTGHRPAAAAGRRARLGEQHRVAHIGPADRPGSARVRREPRGQPQYVDGLDRRDRRQQRPRVPANRPAAASVTYHRRPRSAWRRSSAAESGGGDATRLAAEPLHALRQRRCRVPAADDDHPPPSRSTGSARCRRAAAARTRTSSPRRACSSCRSCHPSAATSSRVMFRPRSAAADPTAHALVAAHKALEQSRLAPRATSRCPCPRPRSAARPSAFRPQRRHAERHRAAVGELDRVADQVDQRLMQLARRRRAAAMGVGEPGAGAGTGPWPQPAGPAGIRSRARLSCRSNGSISIVNRRSSILARSRTWSTRPSRLVAAFRTVAVMSRCSRVQPRRGQQLAHADDRVQGRAQLVAHGGQEVAFGTAASSARAMALVSLRSRIGEIDRQDHQRGDERAGQGWNGAPGRAERHDQREQNQRQAGAAPTDRAGRSGSRGRE